MTTTTKKKLTVGIIGGGMFFDDIIGQTFKDFMRGGIAPGLSSIGMSHFGHQVGGIEIEVVAVGTHSAKSGTAGKIVEWFKKEFPNSPVTAHYGDTVWKDIIKLYKPDVLFVATPDHLHAQPILDALDAGIDVITEKPLCLTTAETDAILKKAAEKQLIVSVDMHKRYDPFVREMMLNAHRKYGQINRVRAVLEEPLEVASEIFAWAEHSNPFAYVGCHWLDVVHHYLKVTPVAVYATGQKNLLANWDVHHAELAKRKGKSADMFKRHHKINTWDSLDVNVTYQDGMRGDYSNNWINPAEFEGAVNQEIEVYGIYGRGFVDQQDRGFRETVSGDGTRTRNPTFGGRIKHHGGNLEVFGYGKASIVSGMLAIIRRRVFGESLASLDETFPTAASQRDCVRIIEAAGIVAQKNFESFQANKGCPVSARLHANGIEIIQP
jgi:predicted dehydrogenase